jgi:hypothetical protein
LVQGAGAARGGCGLVLAATKDGDRTSPGANNGHARRLFDHLVGAGEDQLRHRQAERLRGLKVVGELGGEGANASGLVDDYRAGTE